MSYSLRCISAGVVYDIPEFQSATLGYDFSEVSGLSLTYLESGINASRIDDGAVIVAYWNGVEPFDSRWMVQAGSGSDNPEEGTFIRTGKSLLDIFRRVVVLPTVGNPAGSKVVFNAANVGGILGVLFTAAQARGAMTGITWNFTNTLDSAGAAWNQVVSLDYSPGLKYIDLIRNLVDQGMVELRFNGTQLQAFNAEAMGTDFSAPGASQVELRTGLDYTELPTKWSTEDRAKYAYVLGDDNVVVERTSAAPTGPFGREEIGIGQGGTIDVGTLSLVGDAALSRVLSKRREYTRKVQIRAGGKVPSVDYRVSDYILERVTSLPSRYRIRSMALEVSTDGSIGSASIVLNDKFLESEIRTARKVNGIIGGASVDGSGNGIPTPPDAAAGADVTTPNPVTGLISSTAAYTDQIGVYRAIVTLSWNAPTLNTDGSALSDLQDYEVNWKYSTDADTTWRSIYVSGVNTTWSDLTLGVLVDYRVRARDNAGKVSAWVTSNIMTAVDVTPPPVPSAPTATSKLGTITVNWNGLGSLGEAMPLDFSHAELHMGTSGAFAIDATTLINKFYSKSGMVVTGQPGSSTRYFKLLTVDKSGNKSVVGGETSVLVLRIAGPDIEANSITTNEITAGTIVAEDIAAGTITGDRLVADAITAREIAADSITANELSATAIDGTTITGVTINTGNLKTAAGAARIEVGNTGVSDPVDEIRMWNAGTVSSIRNPSDLPGRIRLSLADGGIIDALSTGDGHRGFVGGATLLKFLLGTAQLQVRNTADNDYGDLTAKTINAQNALNVTGTFEAFGTARARYLVQAGSFTIGAVAASTGSVSGSVGYPMGNFGITPAVTLTTSSSRLTCACTAASTTSWSYSINNWTPAGTAAGVVVRWIAVAIQT